jgi:hypothetical protein
MRKDGVKVLPAGISREALLLNAGAAAMPHGWFALHSEDVFGFSFLDDAPRHPSRGAEYGINTSF